MASKPAATTRHLFQKKPDPKGQITSERISADLRAFRKAGGRIEVLGDTRVLTRIDGGDAPAPGPARGATARGRRG